MGTQFAKGNGFKTQKRVQKIYFSFCNMNIPGPSPHYEPVQRPAIGHLPFEISRKIADAEIGQEPIFMDADLLKGHGKAGRFIVFPKLDVSCDGAAIGIRVKKPGNIPPN